MKVPNNVYPTISRRPLMWRMRMLFLFGIGLPLSAQTININGKVTNSSGKPISHAVVTLRSHDLTANTNAQGAFTLTGEGKFVKNLPPILPSIEKISVSNRMVILNLTKPSRVKIELFE